MADPVRFEQNAFGRWIIRLALETRKPFAWSGSRWVPCDQSFMPIKIQISNFKTKAAAVDYAARDRRFLITAGDLLSLPADPEDFD